MNTTQIVDSATQKLMERTIGMTITEAKDMMTKVVNYTLQAVVDSVEDKDLKEKIRALEVE